MRKLEERFWSKVDKVSSDTFYKRTRCWVWIAGRTTREYGAFWITNKGMMCKAHRVSYEITHESIPEGMNICHHCDNPPCVNPKHLFLGTQQDNISDADDKGRLNKGKGSPKGSKHPQAILTEVQVRAILKDVRTSRKIAKDYGVHRSTISYIKRRTIWKHVK